MKSLTCQLLTPIPETYRLTAPQLLPICVSCYRIKLENEWLFLDPMSLTQFEDHNLLHFTRCNACQKTQPILTNTLPLIAGSQ